MTGIAIAWDNRTGQGDWVRERTGRLAQGDRLASSIWVSLFTDRRLAPDDKPPGGGDDRGGWWGDTYSELPWGSRLWLLRRAKHQPETLRRAETYAREALAWLVRDGVASRVDVAASWMNATFMAIQVGIIHHDGSRSTAEYDWAWQGVS